MIKILNADVSGATMAIYLNSKGKMLAFESLVGVERTVYSLPSAGNTDDYDFEIVISRHSPPSKPGSKPHAPEKPISQMCVKNGITYNWK